MNPLCKFDRLRKALEDRGIHVGDATGFIAIGGEDVLPDNIQNISIVPGEGITYNIGDGRSAKVFLYKRRYRLLQYGKPRYHIRECKTIQEFMSSGTFNTEYRMANTEEVKVINMDDHDSEIKVSALPLCKNCLEIVQNEMLLKKPADFNNYKGSLPRADSSVYSEMLMDGEDAQKEVWVDINGYTDDWPAVSLAYRKKHDFTCERCGVKMESVLDYRFMQTHHKNGVKTNNKESNLECLCIECHSQVDDAHRENFSKGANAIMLESFRKKYRNGAERVININITNNFTGNIEHFHNEE